jgi:acyl-CoA synthetase (AMP-forming)/AMP-acid ligase II
MSSGSGPPSRLRNILGHFLQTASENGGSSTSGAGAPPYIHQLSPTFFLERAASIEPNAEAMYHVTANGKVLRRSYQEFADRARGLAYYLVKNGLKRVGILAPNTPAFLEAIFGIAAAGGVHVGVNYRLKPDDIEYIFDFADVDSIIVDQEFVPLLEQFQSRHPNVRLIIDTVIIPVICDNTSSPVFSLMQKQQIGY